MFVKQSNVIKLHRKKTEKRKEEKRTLTVSYTIPRYYPGQINHCSNCGYSNWHIGRSIAECGWCGQAAILVQS